MYLSDANVHVASSNDSAYLHVRARFSINDGEWARACARTGLTLWLDPTGKKKKDFGIRLAAGPTREDLPARSGSEGQSEQEGPRFATRAPLDGQLTIFRKGETTEAPADGSSGPSGTFTFESGMCTYDLTAPITSISDSRLGLELVPGKSVAVGLTAGLTEEERSEMRQRRQEMGAGRSEGEGEGVAEGEGMGGREGRGMRGGHGAGGGPGGYGGGQGVPANPEAWVKVKLAGTAATGK